MPMRGCSSVASTGLCLARPSMAAQSSFTAPNCRWLLASELSLTNAALNSVCNSGSDSRPSTSPTLRIAKVNNSPLTENKSASWLSPVVVFRRGSISLASRQLM